MIEPVERGEDNLISWVGSQMKDLDILFLLVNYLNGHSAAFIIEQDNSSLGWTTCFAKSAFQDRARAFDFIKTNYPLHLDWFLFHPEYI